MNTAYTELTVSVPLTLSELISLKVDLESVLKTQNRLNMNYSAGVTAGILEKLNDARSLYFSMLEEV